MTERRTRWILIILLVVQLALITAQASSSSPEPTALERGLFRVVAPVAGLVHRVAGVPGSFLEGFRSQRTLLVENRRLEDEVRKLKLELLRLQGLEGEVERLATALDYSTGNATRGGESDLQVADVVYADHRSSLRILILWVGDPARVWRNQPVVNADGLIGRVIFVSGSYAKVQLLTDRSAAVAAMLERTRRQGVIRGVDERHLRLELVPLQADVRPGDRVLTSGLDGVYPRGVAVGTVTRVEPSEDLFHRISVQPAVDFGRVDQVYLLPTEPLPPRLVEEAFGETP